MNLDTTITLGLFLGAIGVITGVGTFIFKAIWWGSALDTKVNTLLSLFTTLTTRTEKLEDRVGGLEKRAETAEERLLSIEKER